MKINSYFQFHILHLEIKCRLIAYGACHDATMSQQHKSYTDYKRPNQESESPVVMWQNVARLQKVSYYKKVIF